MSAQLPLALQHAPSYGREDFFLSPSNDAAFRLVESWPRWPARAVVLSGPPGSGKTHLAHLWAERSGATLLSAAELARAPLPQAGASLAVDDIDPADTAEQSLFHAFNAVTEGGGSLLLIAPKAAEDWHVKLPDLRSRLRLAAPAQLGAPDDALLRMVLVKLFSDRQLLVEKPVIDYMIARMERSLEDASALVAALDRAALAEGRAITRFMAAAILVKEARPGEFADRQ